MNKSANIFRWKVGLVFLASGFASLAYQVVWQRLLTLYYGVGSVSITLIVTLFMFGLGVGSLVGGALAERSRALVRLYFVLQVLLGGFGLVSLPFLTRLGEKTAGSSYLLSLFYMALFLCLPTVLMGMTLPVLTKLLNRINQDFLKTVSFLYFINTLGAAVGALVTSYVLISLGGLDVAIYAASAINFLLALVVLSLPEPGVARVAADVVAGAGESGRPAPFWVYPLVLVTGFLAIGYEIIWFRIIGVLVKSSAYAFSSILGVYLVGIALGSLGMNVLLSVRPGLDRRRLFFSLQFGIGLLVLTITAGYYHLTRHTVFGRLTEASFSRLLHPGYDDLYALLDVFLWPGFFVFGPTLLMGASFPLVSSLALGREDREAKTIGQVYFATILGNVLGGVITGFVLLALWGTENTLRLFVLVGLGFGVAVRSWFGRVRPLALRAGLVVLVAAMALGLLPRSGRLYQLMHAGVEGDERFLEEGVDTVVMTFKTQASIRNFIGGVTHGGRPIPLFFREAAEALGYSRQARTALVIGYGTGSIAETVQRLEEVERIVIVELSGTLMRNLRKIPLFRELLADPRVELIIDDGRRYLTRAKEVFDLILLDPLHSTTAYSSNLYSLQFYRLALGRLAPGGVFLVWRDEHQSMPRTVSMAFPYVRHYDSFSLASNEEWHWQEERFQRVLFTFSPEEQRQILASARWISDGKDMLKATEGYPIIQDWRPVCEYYLGRTLRAWLRRRR